MPDQPTTRTREAIQAEMDQVARDAGMIRVTVSQRQEWRDDAGVNHAVQVTQSSWVEAAITTPAAPPDATPHRTIANPGHDQWKAMDRRTRYRTGCAWHACPNCATYSLTERTDHKEPYWAATGDQATRQDVRDMGPKRAAAEIEWHVERRVDKVIPQHLKNCDEPSCTGCKAVTGTNLFRYHSDRHEECADCGWKGDVPVKSVKPKRVPIDPAWKRRILTEAIERAKLVKGATA